MLRVYFSIVLTSVILAGCHFHSERIIKNDVTWKVGLTCSNHQRWHWIVPAVYDTIIEPASDDYFIVKRNDRWGLINKNGKVVFPIMHDSIVDNASSFYFDRYLIIDSAKYRLGIASQSFVSTVSYDSIWFSHYEESPSPIFILSDHKYGALTSRGSEILFGCDTIQYDPWDCWAEVILYRKNGKCGMITTSGRELVPPEYDSICCWPDLNCTIIPVQIHDSIVYLDRKGRLKDPILDSRSESELKATFRPTISIGKSIKNL